MFDDVSLRKGTKSSLVKAFSDGIVPEKAIPKDLPVILDGGHLLHSFVWPKPARFIDIVESYVKHVKYHFGTNCTVVFDGYPNKPTTKDIEHLRRTGKRISPEIRFSTSMLCTVTQVEFLGNAKNKKRFVSVLKESLLSENIDVIIAEDDADRDIISISLEKHLRGGACVVGQDTDLLVMLIALTPEKPNNMFFMKPPTRSNPSVVYDINKLAKKYAKTRKCLLFIHAISGCDTTSAIYRKGKVQALQILSKNPQLQTEIEIFLNQDSTRDKICEAGEKFILQMYGVTKQNTLDESRYYLYNKATAKLNLKSKFELASLPPTSAAARQHSLRTYLQVQQWQGINLNPTDWGWKLSAGTLQPVPTLVNVAPDELLNMVSCNCKTGCKQACGCRKSGLLCTSMCGQCNGLSCTNSPEINLNNDDDDDAGITVSEDLFT